MNKNIKKILVVSVLISLILIYTYPGMIGRVVDAETGEPIEGAVIMAEWTKKEGLPGLTHTESYKVIEAVTGKNGWAWISGSYKPTAQLGSLAVYKKGYVAWSKDAIFPDYKKRISFTWCCFYKVFKLERFRPEYSYDDHTSFIRSSTSSHSGNKKLIMEAFEWERKKASEERDNFWKEEQRMRNE